MTKRTLVLRRQQLTELTTEDLLDVNGAAVPPTQGCPVVTFTDCVTRRGICAGGPAYTVLCP
jgi:hypothetical protein